MHAAAECLAHYAGRLDDHPGPVGQWYSSDTENCSVTRLLLWPARPPGRAVLLPAQFTSPPGCPCHGGGGTRAPRVGPLPFTTPPPGLRSCRSPTTALAGGRLHSRTGSK